METKYFLALMGALVITLSLTSAACTVTLDKDTYFGGQTAVATLVCSSPSERGDPYTLVWNDGTTDIETDTGTVPTTTAQAFFETLQIPTGETWTSATASLTLVALEDTATFNVTPTAAASTLVVRNVTFTSSDDLFIGKTLGIRALVYDTNGYKISNANCQFDLEDGSNLPITASTDVSHDGIAQKGFDLNIDTFDENRQYVARVSCFCGTTGTTAACISENGTEVSNSIGSASDTFTTQQWITVNTVTSDETIGVGEEFSICANVTNPSTDDRLDIEVFYNWRCGSGSDSDTDRIVIGEYTELRGISANTTQMQCHDFIVPNEERIEKGAYMCYGATSVSVLNEAKESLVTYPTTSPQFNVTIYSIHPDVDFYRVSQNTFSGNITFDKFDIGINDVHVILDGDLNGEETSLTSISNYTITYTNGSAIPYSTSALFHEHAIRNQENLVWGDAIEIGINDVNTTLDEEFTLTFTFDNYAQRQAIALEGVENKTGTFHLDVDCPSTTTLGTDMNCSITAYIEDTQTFQKEVDFTCYISDGNTNYSALNFNQMTNKTPLTLYKTFYVPTTLSQGNSYILQCHADYYNLGSRRDSFYDTFTIPGTSSSSSSGTSGWGQTTTEEETIFETTSTSSKSSLSPITGGIIGAISMPSTKTISTAAIIIIAVLTITYFFIPKKEHITKIQKTKKRHLYLDHRILLAVINLLALILAITAIIFLIQKFTTLGETSRIIQDPLLQKIIFITFLTTITILLFKALNIQINISFNKQNPIEKYWKQKIKEN